MNMLNRKLEAMLLAAILFAFGLTTHADSSQTFDTPLTYCFDQAQRSASTNQFTLSYTLIVDKEYQGVSGYIFTGFKNKDGLWLKGGDGVWRKHTDGFVDIGASQNDWFYQLQPIMQQPIVSTPTDVSSLQGELFIGYGIRETATSTLTDAFNWMVANNKYSRALTLGYVVDYTSSVCFNVTGVSININPSTANADSKAQ